MIRAAVQTTYLKACLNPSRQPIIKKFNMSAMRSIVTTVDVPKVNYIIYSI